MKTNKEYMNLLNELIESRKEYINIKLDVIEEEIETLRKENEEDRKILQKSVNEFKRLVKGE